MSGLESACIDLCRWECWLTLTPPAPAAANMYRPIDDREKRERLTTPRIFTLPPCPWPRNHVHPVIRYKKKHIYPGITSWVEKVVADYVTESIILLLVSPASSGICWEIFCEVLDPFHDHILPLFSVT